MNTILLFLQETITRLKTESPEYFVKLRKAAAWIAVVSFVISYVPFIYGIIGYHPSFTTFQLNIFTLAGNVWPWLAGVFGFSFLPVVHTEKQALYHEGQHVFVAATKEAVMITEVQYETEMDTVTGKTSKAISYKVTNTANQEATYYEAQLTNAI